MASANRPQSPFVGRAHERQVLEQAYADSAEGRPQIVFVSGETGIGKTRLVDEFIATVGPGRLALRGGAPVLVGKQTPFAPVVALLRDLERQVGEGGDAVRVAPDSELGQLLPGATSRGVEASAAENSSRTRLFEQFIGLLARLGAQSQPVVVALEDLHWADDSTLDLLAYVVRNLTDGQVMLVCTQRAANSFELAAIDRLIIEAMREPSVTYVQLRALTEPQTAALIAAVASETLPDEEIAKLARKAGGNPLFAEHLAANGPTEILPSSLVSIVRLQAASLSRPALRVARLAAIAGVAIPASYLEPAASAVADESAAVDEVLEAGILRRERDGGLHVYVFRHPLDQEVLEADIAEAERTKLHLQLAQAINAQADKRELSATEIADLARHWTAASEHARAFQWLMSAAQCAESVFAFSAAHGLYETAFQALPYAERDTAGHGADWAPRRRALIERAAQAASLAGAPQRALELIGLIGEGTASDARLISLRAQYLWETGRYDESLGAHRTAVALASKSNASDAIGILRAAARTSLIAGMYEDARDWAREAVARARSTENVSEARDSLYTLGAASAHLGDGPAAVRYLEEARQAEATRRKQSRLSPRPSRIVDLLAGYWSSAAILDRSGEPEGSAQAALEGVRRAHELGVAGGWGGLVGLAAVEQLIGLSRWNEAGAVLDVQIDTGPVGSSALLAARAYLQALTGRTSEGLASLELARQRALASPTEQPRYALMAAHAGAALSIATNQLSEASRCVDEALAQPPRDADARDRAELVALSLRILADRAEVARLLKDGPDLADLVQHAAQLDGELVALAADAADGARHGSDSRLAAIALWGRCEYQRALGHNSAEQWLKLDEAWLSVHDAYRGAYALMRAAEVQLASHAGREAARVTLRTARQTALEIGAEPLRREIDALARRSRIELAPEPAKDADQSTLAQPFGLTSREIEVLALISEGRTNRQIASALFISDKTAGHHVSNILAKLEVASRVEAAGIAVRLGIGRTPDETASSASVSGR